MSLQTKVMDALKEAMKAKDTIALESLRAIKSAILLAKTEAGAAAELVKQRKDSAALYTQQGRNDLAEPELAQVAVIEKFLPKQLSEAEVTEAVKAIIAEVGATSAKDMGKVMGVATKQLAGKTDGKVISAIVKSLLA